MDWAEEYAVNLSANTKSIFQLGKTTVLAWSESKVPRLGAALAYYSIFAIAPLFLLTLGISGIWFGDEAARRELFGQLQGLVGSAGAKGIEALVTAASNKPKSGAWAACIATATLAVAATGVFVELQDALNTIWQVKTPSGGSIRKFIKVRLLSFAMLLGIGFLLLISLILSASLSALSTYVGGFLPTHFLWGTLNFIVSLAVVSVLFALILKVLPDVRINWKDVWIGGILTAVFFNAGKFLLGFYLGRSSVASAYGAAGSLVIILLWVYYSAQIMFFGAVFTKVYATRYGSLQEYDEKAPPLKHFGPEHSYASKKASQIPFERPETSGTFGEIMSASRT